MKRAMARKDRDFRRDPDGQASNDVNRIDSPPKSWCATRCLTRRRLPSVREPRGNLAKKIGDFGRGHDQAGRERGLGKETPSARRLLEEADRL
jgi:hypothetical protein